MEEVLNFLQNDPFTIVLIAVAALILAVLIIFPTLFSYLKSFKVPLAIPMAIPKPAKIEKEETPKEKHDVSLPKLNLKGFKIKSPKTALAGGVAIVALLIVGYLSYDFFARPVRIVNAWQLKLEQGGKLSKLQKGGFAVWPEVKVYLLDLRSRESYAEEHLVGSGSLPANRAKSEFYPIEGVPVIIYSGEHNFEDVREVADAIVKKGEDTKIQKYKNPGKIIIIKDGIEGLKKSGFKTEAGIWD